MGITTTRIERLRWAAEDDESANEQYATDRSYRRKNDNATKKSPTIWKPYIGISGLIRQRPLKISNGFVLWRQAIGLTGRLRNNWSTSSYSHFVHSTIYTVPVCSCAFHLPLLLCNYVSALFEFCHFPINACCALSSASFPRYKMFLSDSLAIVDASHLCFLNQKRCSAPEPKAWRSLKFGDSHSRQFM